MRVKAAFATGGKTFSVPFSAPPPQRVESQADLWYNAR